LLVQDGNFCCYFSVMVTFVVTSAFCKVSYITFDFINQPGTWDTVDILIHLYRMSD